MESASPTPQAKPSLGKRLGRQHEMMDEIRHQVLQLIELSEKQTQVIEDLKKDKVQLQEQLGELLEKHQNLQERFEYEISE